MAKAKKKEKKLKPTPQQQAFLDALTDSKNKHLALVARAGCGKTSTIIMGVDLLAGSLPDHTITLCAFNKAIADELKEKLYSRNYDWRHVQASTLHGLGLGLVRYAFGGSSGVEVDEKKIHSIIDDTVDSLNAPKQKRIYEQYRSQIIALVKMAKQAGFGFFSDLPISDDLSWHMLADHFDINGLDDTSESEAVVAAAQYIYRKSLEETSVIDFDDMILFPLIKNLRVKFTRDFVFLDEAQDLSRARQALAKKLLSQRGRLVIVGDDRQAIYGFSGADSSALENLISSMDAKILPLSVTWRCPKVIVDLAKTIVPDIEAAPSAPEGAIKHILQERALKAGENGHSAPQTPVSWFRDAEVLETDLSADDAVLCRNTAPLVSLAYKMIKAGIACKVEGRAIGNGLKALACRWKVKTIDKLLIRLETYKERERQKALAKGNESKAEEVGDRVDTLLQICQACAEAGEHDVSDVVKFIENLFVDGATNVTVLATYHRAKGREWKRVFLLEHDARCPSRAARQPWQRHQEQNLAYVAFTRAKDSLIFVL